MDFYYSYGINDFIDKLSLLETDNHNLYCDEVKKECLCENDNIVLGTNTDIYDIISRCSR